MYDEKDSCGGVIECIVYGLPAGVGDPVFEKLDACLAKAVMSIGAVKAVEIGDGVSVSTAAGSKNNDAFFCDKDVRCMAPSQTGLPVQKRPTMPEEYWEASATVPGWCSVPM